MVHGPWSFVIVALLAAHFVSGPRTVAAQQYTFDEVASGLKHQDAATRLRAIQILKDADYAEAAIPIAAALADPDERVQLAAMDAERSLFTTRPLSRRRKVGFVIEVRSVSGGDAADGQLALKARAVPAQILSGLHTAMRVGSPRVRAEAISLASLLAPQACEFGPDPLSAVEAGDGCGLIGNALVDNINSRNPVVRRLAMQGLGQLRYPNATQALSDQLSYYQKGPDALAALEGLAGIGHSISASIFRQQLTSPSADMRRLAVEGLARGGEREALAEIQSMGQAERSNGVLLALHYAGVRLGAPGSDSQPIVAALRNASLRPLALKYLLDLAPSIGPALADGLRDESPDARRLVACVLGFSRDVKVVPALEAATQDSDADVALAAQQAIERIKLMPPRRSPGAGG